MSQRVSNRKPGLSTGERLEHPIALVFNGQPAGNKEAWRRWRLGKNETNPRVTRGGSLAWQAGGVGGREGSVCQERPTWTRDGPIFLDLVWARVGLGSSWWFGLELVVWARVGLGAILGDPLGSGLRVQGGT